MLTIDIPVSNARVSEEDAFAKYILDGIMKDGKKSFLWYGCGTGFSWEDGYSDDPCSTKTICSGKSIRSVIEKFEAKGYAVIYGETCAAGQYVTIKG